MPLTLSNTLTQTTTPSLSAALQKKINPQPLAFAMPPITPVAPAPATAAKTTTTPAPTSSGLLGSVKQPAAQASYSGGQALPAVGTPQYAQAQQQAYAPQIQQQPPIQVPTTPPKSLFERATEQLINQKNTEDLQKRAQEIASTAGQKISDIGGAGARGQAGYRTTGTSPVGEGNAAVLAQTTAAQQQAVSQGAQTELQGIDKGLTAQGLIQSALGTAGGLAAPQQLPYGTQYGTPEQLMAAQQNGQGGGALNPLNNVQSLAEQVINGQISPAQAYAMGGNITNFQGVLNQAIQQAKPGFNTATAQGSFDARQANTVTSGTTPTTTAASIYATAYPQLLDLQNAVGNVDNFGHLLLNTMVDKNGTVLNPYDVKYANTVLANIRSELSSAQQATFDTTFAQLKAQIAALLSTGGSQIPTEITNDAKRIIDGSLPLSSLDAVLKRIATEGKILESNLQAKINTAGSTISAPKVGGGSNPLAI